MSWKQLSINLSLNNIPSERELFAFRRRKKIKRKRKNFYFFRIFSMWKISEVLLKFQKKDFFQNKKKWTHIFCQHLFLVWIHKFHHFFNFTWHIFELKWQNNCWISVLQFNFLCNKIPNKTIIIIKIIFSTVKFDQKFLNIPHMCKNFIINEQFFKTNNGPQMCSNRLKSKTRMHLDENILHFNHRNSVLFKKIFNVMKTRICKLHDCFIYDIPSNFLFL